MFGFPLNHCQKGPPSPHHKKKRDKRCCFTPCCFSLLRWVPPKRQDTHTHTPCCLTEPRCKQKMRICTFCCRSRRNTSQHPREQPAKSPSRNFRSKSLKSSMSSLREKRRHQTWLNLKDIFFNHQTVGNSLLLPVGPTLEYVKNTKAIERCLRFGQPHETKHARDSRRWRGSPYRPRRAHRSPRSSSPLPSQRTTPRMARPFLADRFRREGKGPTPGHVDGPNPAVRFLGVLVLRVPPTPVLVV